MIDYGILIILVHNAYLTPKGKPMPKIQPEKNQNLSYFALILLLGRSINNPNKTPTHSPPIMINHTNLIACHHWRQLMIVLAVLGVALLDGIYRFVSDIPTQDRLRQIMLIVINP